MQNAGPQIRALSFSAASYALEPDQSKNWFSEESLLKSSTDLIQLSDTNENEEADDSSCQEKRSPSVSSANSESPTPTNSRDGQGWRPDSDHWQQSLMSDEHRQLLGTEEESSDKHSEASHSETSSDSSSEQGDSDSSSPPEEEEIESVYAIRPDQRAYYIERFRQLQSDGTNLLPGLKAKEFFAKSKLPLSELSKIWELSDVTRDGALSIEEFLVAMHLVVLRRNNIPVPDILPPCLNIPVLPVSSVANSVSSVQESRVASDVLIPDLEPSSLETENKSPVKQRESPVKNEWTKFVESPTAESISSPGPKPVNFDFQKIAIEQDPRIIHPIPRRLTPEMQLDGSAKLSQRPGLRQPSASFASGDDIHGPTSLPFSNRKDPPPPPPPRPSKGHARSASLDLNSLGAPYRVTTSQPTAIKPLIPPRVSPSLTPRRAKNQTSLDTNGDNIQPTVFQSPADIVSVQTEVVHAGAFEVYRKTDLVDSSIKPKQEDGSSQATQSVISRRKRSSLGAIIDQHRTRNEALRRQHRDLLGDLATLLEEKSILEVRLTDQKNC